MKPLGASNVIDFPRAHGASRRARPKRVVAVGGGKGGIGKTLVSVNLSIALSQKGQRVVLFDADMGGANVHTALGLAAPRLTVSDFLNRRVGALTDVVLPSGVPNLSVIAGSQDLLDAAHPKHHQKLKLIRHLMGLDADFVVLDLGAGTSLNVLDFFLLADTGVLVLLPEPTSIENAYRFIKAAFFRKVQSYESDPDLADAIEAALVEEVRNPVELIARVRAQDEAAARRLQAELASFRACLVVNQARTEADRTVGNAVVAAWKKFFGLEMTYLGAIGYDDEAWRAVRRRRPLLLERPTCPAAEGLIRVAENLLSPSP